MHKKDGAEAGRDVYEEVLDVYQAEDEMDVFTRVWGVVETIILVVMFAIMLMAILSEHPKNPKQWTLTDKEIIGTMILFVFYAPISFVLCFILSAVIYLPLWIVGKKNTAYKFKRFYPYLNHLIEIKLLIVSFVLGVRHVMSDSFQHRPWHQAFYVSMIILCMLFFSLRVAWFFTKNKEESETEQHGENIYRVKKDRRGDREEV